MHILSLRRLREFWAEHPDAEASLRSWYRVAKQARWQRFTDVRAHYRSADQVGKFTVFNIAGNAYRLITVIHFNTGRVYVRRVLTHAAYTRGTWQDDYADGTAGASTEESHSDVTGHPVWRDPRHLLDVDSYVPPAAPALGGRLG